MSSSVPGHPIVNVGFIGLGDQGAPIALAIADAGWSLHVWARRPSSLGTLASCAHTVHATAPSLGRAVDLLCLCVSDDGDVDELLHEQGLLGALRSGTVVANHGTGSPRAAGERAAVAVGSGVLMLDAPVSGGAAAARARTLTMMVGGDLAALERARSVFAAFTDLTLHVGPAGSGQTAKLLNNVLFAANLRNVETLLAAAADLGVDLTNVVRLIEASSGSSYALRAMAEFAVDEPATHAQRLLRKDLRHFTMVAADHGVACPDLLEAARRGIEGIPAAGASLAPSEQHH